MSQSETINRLLLLGANPKDIAAMGYNRSVVNSTKTRIINRSKKSNDFGLSDSEMKYASFDSNIKWSDLSEHEKSFATDSKK